MNSIGTILGLLQSGVMEKMVEQAPHLKDDADKIIAIVGQLDDAGKKFLADLAPIINSLKVSK